MEGNHRIFHSKGANSGRSRHPEAVRICSCIPALLLYTALLRRFETPETLAK
jgi:hypothetical protein